MRNTAGDPFWTPLARLQHGPADSFGSLPPFQQLLVFRLSVPCRVFQHARGSRSDRSSVVLLDMVGSTSAALTVLLGVFIACQTAE
ncbi:hypothetical protein AMECASPLE_010540 [Ameca splendens]|uniref:Uncharacterized protein n=1 Tax=Ameca splendens TaxID=208324 RepID=A0ABV0Z9D8_9TELE